MSPPVVLTVAAVDPLGGAGVAADLTTFAALGSHGVTAVTAVTAQHFRSVDRLDAVAPEMVAAQLDALIEEVSVAALKTGLLARVEVIELVAERVREGRLPAPVVDPVLVDRRGERLFSADVEHAYRELLVPAAVVLTPNVYEAELLVGRPLGNVDEISAAAAELAGLGSGLVIVTGGASGDDTTDVAITADGEVELLTGPRIDTGNVRGTGCTFSAAIAAFMAAGDSPMRAARNAKSFVTDRLTESAEWTIARPEDSGPIGHTFGR